MTKLFEIISWKREDDYIVVNIDENKYTTSNTIVIQEEKFEKYLKKCDRLYFETHDCSLGSYSSQSHTLSIDEYFNESEYDYIAEDLYDYISVRHIDFDKAMLITENAIKSLKKCFNL